VLNRPKWSRAVRIEQCGVEPNEVEKPNDELLNGTVQKGGRTGSHRFVEFRSNADSKRLDDEKR